MGRHVTDDERAGLKALRRQLDKVLTRDYGRLHGRWRKLSRAHRVDAAQLAALADAIDKSVAACRARAASRPPLALDEALPVSAHADAIIQAIRKHPVIVVAGATGSGKTTQLPQLCLAAGRGVAGMVGCTQPRRLAARSVARRVAEEMGTEVGGKVGFQVRFHEQVGDATLVKFMTDGILLAETQSDPWLSAYDTLIIDEAHERSLNIDFLVGYLKRLLARRRNLKVIVTSATIDTARFARHFDDAPVIEVEGRTWPVEVRWRPPDEEESGQGEPAHVARAVDELTRDAPRGDILVFLPGEREIRETHHYLEHRQYRHTEILPLYARLSNRDQDRVFHPGAQRRIVLATNVAETSLTVPRIHAVIDTGTARVLRYSQRTQIERLHVEAISQAAADQRKGRCGRLGPGVCIRLYAEADYAARPRFTDPELLRSSLANVILRMLALRLGDVESFPFLDPPEPRAISDGYRRLAELRAIDDERRLTALGRELARLPIDVQLARMLIEARRLGVVRELLVIVAFLSVRDPRERPPEARQQADAAHRQFTDPRSDFVGLLKLWEAWTEACQELTQSKLRDWCRKHYLGFLRMREWREVHRQLKVMMGPEPGTGDQGPVTAWLSAGGRQGRGKTSSDASRTERKISRSHRGAMDASPATPATHPPVPDDPDPYAPIHLSLLAGLPTLVGHKDEHGVYRGTRGRKFQLFPGSALVRKAPAWVFSGQVLDMGGKVWGMQCAQVEPEWIERQAAHMLRHSWHDPHFSRERGCVVAFEQVTLFGLALVERRPVVFRDQDPARAHAIFVREGLVRGEVDARADFIAANRRVRSKAEDVEARERRQGMIRPEEDLVAFFAGKLPEDIADARALDAWYRKASAAQRAALAWTLADVLRDDEALDARAFPSELELGGQRYRLGYRFVPGDAADGVTVHLPIALLNAIPDEPCQWLVPGLVAEKVAALIRGLPKSLRRNFVPAPDFARAFLETEPSRQQPLAQALAAFLVRATGVRIEAADFADVDLPAHLAMRFVLEDTSGKQLAASRDLAELRSQWKGQAQAAFSRRADLDLTRENLTHWDFDAIPPRVTAADKPDAYPALVDLGESVALRVFERNAEARQAHVRGVRRLLRLDLAKHLDQAQRKLPVKRTTALQYSPLGSLADLRVDLVAGGFAELLATCDLDVRDRDAYVALRDHIAAGCFGAAVERLKLAEPIIAGQAEAARCLEPARPGQAPASHADLREQFEHLMAPGFLRDVPAAQLGHYPRYLKAMCIRAERLRHDPGKDHRHLQLLAPYWRAYLEHARANETSEALQRVRWLIEEWRVSLFAQELKTVEPVSAKRVARALEALG